MTTVADRKPISMNKLFEGYLRAYGLERQGYRFEFKYTERTGVTYSQEPYMNKVTTCVILDRDLNPLARGEAGCYSKDRYVKWRGQMLAMGRAWDQLKRNQALTRLHA